MKVLLLPNNTASDMSHKVRALRSIGVDARGLALGGHAIQTATDVELFPLAKGQHFSNLRTMISFAQRMYQLVQWADVLHWIWDFGSIPFKLDKRIVQRFHKPGVVQWAGSDIRIPEADFPHNPYYKYAFEHGYEYPFESRQHSMRNQRGFADVGFYPLAFIGMEHYIDRTLFPKIFRVWQSVVLAEHSPSFPDPFNRKPLILHSPTAPVCKGTSFVLQAVDHLKRSYDFDFVRLERVERTKALELMQKCDVYIDQLTIGMHGSAAVEAMAFGKPVVCYINPVTAGHYPPDLPIVNANTNNIAEKLEALIQSAELRHELGKKGRAYVDKYHEDKTIAHELHRVYEEVLALHEAKTR